MIPAPRTESERLAAAEARAKRRAQVVAALSSVVPAHALLWRQEDTTPYECDGLTAYRQQPLVVALPETEAQVAALLRACHRLEVPVIAAVNGPAIGAGFDLCCMCDIRIGSELAKFGETFINLGIIPGDGGAWFLPRVVGPQRAAELTFSGRVIDARQALDYGLLMEITTPDELLETALEMAGTFAQKPRSALRISKRLLQMGQRLPLADFLDYCASQQSLCHGTEEHRIAMDQVLSGSRG